MHDATLVNFMWLLNLAVILLCPLFEDGLWIITGVLAPIYLLRVLRNADQIGDVGTACRYFGVSRASFYRWQAGYRQHGVSRLENRKTTPKNPPIGLPRTSSTRSCIYARCQAGR